MCLHSRRCSIIISMQVLQDLGFSASLQTYLSEMVLHGLKLIVNQVGGQGVVDL